ncbi:MAG: ABC transporter permease [Actinobacteria bacterium]|nr:ABC transporter permease [Actinomycetota bacterium]
MRGTRFLTSVVAPAIALLIAFVLAGFALLLVDINPLDAYREMWNFGITPESLISAVNRAVPLFVSALAVAIGFKMGLFNIGVEGAYLLAALLAAYVGALYSIPAMLHVASILIVGMVVGAIWNGLAGWLKVRRGVHEVISTIMLNFIAFNLSAYLFIEHLKAETGGLTTATDLIPATGWIPSLNPILVGLGMEPRAGSELHGFLVIAIVLGVGYHLLVNRSRFGYDLRASGINPAAAHASGVNPKRMVISTMLISGSVAGLVGMSELLGFQHQYVQDFPVGYGFNGIAVALLGRNNPVGMAFGALLFGFMNRAALILDLRGVPREIVTIIQGLVVLTVVIVYEIISRYVTRRTVAAAARAAAMLEEETAAA